MSKLQYQVSRASLFLLLVLAGGILPILAMAQNYAAAENFEMITCLGTDGDVKFEIQIDRVDPQFPQAMAMRVSDPNVSIARQEIAFFDASQGLLSTEGTSITGHVSEVHPLTSRRGERIGGTVLGALKQVTVVLDIDFSQELNPRKRHAATVTYLKKIGEELVQDLDCRRQK